VGNTREARPERLREFYELIEKVNEMVDDLRRMAGGHTVRKVTLDQARRRVGAQGRQQRPEPQPAVPRPQIPSAGEPEGMRPGRKPSGGEPDDPSPGGAPWAQPAAAFPLSAKVPTRESAEGRPPSGSPSADERVQAYLIAAAAMQLAGVTFRSQPDLREMLREAVTRVTARGAYDFVDALERAKRQIVQDVRAGLR
jgi:hypothetical protein